MPLSHSFIERYVLHKKAEELSKAMMSKNKKKTPPAKKGMGHTVDSAAHKRMMSKKSGY